MWGGSGGRFERAAAEDRPSGWDPTGEGHHRCQIAATIAAAFDLFFDPRGRPRRLALRALAVPLSYLAFLSLLALLGLMALGAAIHVLGTVRARWPQWRGVEQAK